MLEIEVLLLTVVLVVVASVLAFGVVVTGATILVLELIVRLVLRLIQPGDTEWQDLPACCSTNGHPNGIRRILWSP